MQKNILLLSTLLTIFLLSGCLNREAEMAQIRFKIVDCDGNPVFGAKLRTNNAHTATTPESGNLILDVSIKRLESLFPLPNSPYTFDTIRVENLKAGESRSLGTIVANECSGHLTVKACQCENNPWSGQIYAKTDPEIFFGFTGSTNLFVPPGKSFLLDFWPAYTGDFYLSDTFAMKRYTLDNAWLGVSPFAKSVMIESGQSDTLIFNVCNASVIQGVIGVDSIYYSYPEWRYILFDTYNGFSAAKSRSSGFTGKAEIEWRFPYKPQTPGQTYLFPDSTFEMIQDNIRFLNQSLSINYSKRDSGYIHGHIWGTLFDSQNINHVLPIDLYYKLSTLSD